MSVWQRDLCWILSPAKTQLLWKKCTHRLCPLYMCPASRWQWKCHCMQAHDPFWGPLRQAGNPGSQVDRSTWNTGLTQVDSSDYSLPTDRGVDYLGFLDSLGRSSEPNHNFLFLFRGPLPNICS